MQETNGTIGWLWPLWGAAAGVLGIIAHIVMMPDVTDEQRLAGPAVVDLLESGNYHAGVVAGMLAVFCLLVLASGWRRWLVARAPLSLAAGVVPLAIAASAGALILAYGFKGMLAIYLPGGMDVGFMSNEGLFVLYVIDDMASFMGWYGVAMAAGALAWVSLRERLIPIWFGLLSALFAVAPLVILVITGLPGFPGVIIPVWLIIGGIGMALSLRRAPAKATRANVAVAAN